MDFCEFLWIFEEFLYVLVTFREHSVDFQRLLWIFYWLLWIFYWLLRIFMDKELPRVRGSGVEELTIDQITFREQREHRKPPNWPYTGRFVTNRRELGCWSRCVKKSVWALHRVHWCSRWCKPDRQVYPNVQSGRPPDVRDMLEAGWFVPCGGWVLTEVSGSPWELDLKIEKKLYWLLWIFYWLLVKFHTFIHTFVDILLTFSEISYFYPHFCGYSIDF